MFKPGQSGNPAGRAKKVTEAAYLEAFKLAFPPEELAKTVIRPLKRQARKGNAKAAQILLEQAMGKPTQRVEVTVPQDEALLNLQRLMIAKGVKIDNPAPELTNEPAADSTD